MGLTDYITDKPVLRTERLTLRQLIPSDTPALKEWMADKSMYTYLRSTENRPEMLNCFANFGDSNSSI